jgi:aspartate/methionine/tyrosine aminotransferase
MSTSSTGQIAALAALAAPGDYLDERRAFVRSHRDLAVSGLRAAGLGCATPQGGFFAWVDIAGCGLSAPEFTERCAGEIGVLLSPGDDFGVAGRRHVRLNYAVPPPRLMTALDLLATWVRTLRRTTDKTPVEISDAR